MYAQTNKLNQYLISFQLPIQYKIKLKFSANWLY